jgi:hypothetical protein
MLCRCGRGRKAFDDAMRLSLCHPVPLLSVVVGLLSAFMNAGEALDPGPWVALREQPAHLGWEDAREEFLRVYGPVDAGALDEWVRFEEEAAWVRVAGKLPGLWLELPWPASAAGGEGWLPPPAGEGEPLLRGWRIALDPGHLGGEWGPMERRSFGLDGGPVVQEGDLVLAAARRLRDQLREAGAEVLLLREEASPVTAKRPEDFLLESFKDLLRETGKVPDEAHLRRLAEMRFYRGAEIEARAEQVASWRPHLVLALHIDAAAWPDPSAPSPVAVNYGHILVHGAYLPSELADDRQRLQCLRRWRAGFSGIEVSVGTALAEAMERVTGLPPFTYRGPNARRVNQNPYLWARNLMANRIFEAPVIYLEPWVLNHAEVYSWAALGDYEGEREVAGTPKASLPALYAAFVSEGLQAWARERAFESPEGASP